MLKPIRKLQDKATAYYRRNMVGIDTVTLPGSGFFSSFTRCLQENPPMSKKQAKAMLEPIVDHLMDQVIKTTLPPPHPPPGPALHPLTHSPTSRSTKR